MIKHRYKAKVCDICGETLAVKKKFFYDKKRSYSTFHAETYTGSAKVHLCDDCLSALSDEVRKALAKRSEGK